MWLSHNGRTHYWKCATFMLVWSTGHTRNVTGIPMMFWNCRQGCACSVYPTLCDPLDCSPPGSSVHGISQARKLQSVAISSSNGIFLTQGSDLHSLSSALQADSLPTEQVKFPPANYTELNTTSTWSFNHGAPTVNKARRDFSPQNMFLPTTHTHTS